jgi:hypothetical protein
LKSIGINALTANMLCGKHNSALSEVDAEGIASFKAIRRFEEVLSRRRPVLNATDLEHHAQGHLLERWFIKHAINLFVIAGRGKRWYGGSEPANPPRDIVEAAVGMHHLEQPRGLYNWAGSRVGERRVVGDQLGFVPIYDGLGEYVGALFEFQALSFLIWLQGGRPGPREVPWAFARSFYHHFGGHFEAPPLTATFRIHW